MNSTFGLEAASAGTAAAAMPPAMNSRRVRITFVRYHEDIAGIGSAGTAITRRPTLYTDVLKLDARIGRKHERLEGVLELAAIDVDANVLAARASHLFDRIEICQLADEIPNVGEIS